MLLHNVQVWPTVLLERCASPKDGIRIEMSDMTLAALVKAAAEKFAIPGVAVAVWVDGTETYACHGVTSLEDPRPVDEHTLYALGSISKTFTATAIMRLVAQGMVDLDAPVRRYVPELVLRNE